MTAIHKRKSFGSASSSATSTRMNDTSFLVRFPHMFLTSVLVALALPATATTVRQLALTDLCQNAHRIIRGIVLDANPGTVEAGGGRIPTVTYRIKVHESFYGSQPGIVDLTMVADPKEGSSAHGNLKRFALFRDLPKLEKGKEYLLFTTTPSRIGLCTTVGLGQGCFQIVSRNKTELAVNGVNNRGLGLAADGPVDYAILTANIRSLLKR